MKGQHEVLTIIITTGILFGVIGAVWLWSTPVIERNKETFVLRSTEDFTKALSDSIKFVAKNGGRAQMRITALDPRGSILLGNESVEIFTVTAETSYDKNIQVPLNEIDCATTEATWGLNSSDSICILSVRIGQEKVRTTYAIRFIQLNAEDGSGRAYRIVLQPLTASSGLDKNYVTVENKGVQETSINGRTLISTLVAISIV